MTNFNEPINRVNTDSVKWDGMKALYGTDDLLPMWVADTDFASPVEVTEAIIRRASHGIFGYTISTPQNYQPFINWVQKRYHWEISENWLLPSSGVVQALAYVIQALTDPGDKILIQSPVYQPFFKTIEANNREIVNSQLRFNGVQYEIDFSDFENKLKTGVKLFIMCNPHNPVGRVWSKEELWKIAELCKEYGVLILSDEIHADLIYKPNTHTPIASLDKSLEEITVSCYAPSKTFNIPGLQASVIVAPNDKLRSKIQIAQSKIGFHGLNLFGKVAFEEAYKHGEEWLEELLVYLQENTAYTKQFIEKELPNLRLVKPEGTYLLWIDCNSLGLTDQKLQERLVQKGKLALEPGNKYGPGGEGFVRMNIGCPRTTLEEGLRRLKLALE